MRATFPLTDVFPGSVTSARSPFFTSPCCEASRATCTSGRVGRGLRDRRAGPGGSAEGPGHLGDPHRLGEEDHLVGGELAGLVEPRVVLELLECLLGPRR